MLSGWTYPCIHISFSRALFSDPLFCSLYSYTYMFASKLGLVDTEHGLLSAKRGLERNGSTNSSAKPSVWWSPQIVDSLSAHLASPMANPGTTQSCTVTTFANWGKSKAYLEYEAIKLGGRLL